MKKYIYILSISFFFLTISYLIYSNKNNKKYISTSTTPVIPSKSIKKILPESINVLNENQQTIFDWGNVIPDIPKSITNYKIVTPLINSSLIISLANKFKFTNSDKSKETSENTYLWINKNASLFGSPKQNQISYYYKYRIPDGIFTSQQEKIIENAKKNMSSLFGENVIETFEDTGKIKYLNLIQNQVEVEPEEVDQNNGNIAFVDFIQKIDGFPLLSRSRSGEIASIGIDTKNDIYHINLYGGYSVLEKIDEVTPLNFIELKNIAPSQAFRISFSKDHGSERFYSVAKVINVKVESVITGYYQQDNTKLIPVIIVNGIMSVKGLQSYPATYVVPLTPAL